MVMQIGQAASHVQGHLLPVALSPASTARMSTARDASVPLLSLSLALSICPCLLASLYTEGCMLAPAHTRSGTLFGHMQHCTAAGSLHCDTKALFPSCADTAALNQAWQAAGSFTAGLHRHDDAICVSHSARMLLQKALQGCYLCCHLRPAAWSGSEMACHKSPARSSWTRHSRSCTAATALNTGCEHFLSRTPSRKCPLICTQ